MNNNNNRLGNTASSADKNFNPSATVFTPGQSTSFVPSGGAQAFVPTNQGQRPAPMAP
jgi:hypothetical protein